MYDIFSLKDFKFPEGFLWGSAVSGHQVEGNNVNAQFWYEENHTTRFEEKSGMACNNYNMYKDDIKLLTELGHKAFRFSIEWSRIEPEDGVFCEEALNHYLDELEELKKNGIKVFLTLVHATIPLWFDRIGGFKKIENLKYFERYLEFIIPKVAQYVDLWNVINEFNLGNWTEEHITFKLNSVRYHALGYHIIKKYSDKPVSSAHALVYYMPYRAHDKFDNILTQYKDWQDHEFFFHAMRTGEILYPYRDGVYDASVKDTCDFWSINTYVRDLIDARRASGNGDRYNHKELKMINKRWYLEEMYPEGMLANLTRLTDKPVYISENGCSADDDRFRIVWIALHLSALKDALDCGIDVRGYMYWSLMDNYEWGSYVPKFGLVSVDRETFERTKKPSAHFYKEIIENNGFSQDILRKYLDKMPSLGLK